MYYSFDFVVGLQILKEKKKKKENLRNKYFLKPKVMIRLQIKR